MVVKEVDFSAYLNRSCQKVFKFVDSSGSLYDFSDSTSVTLKFYKDILIPLEIMGSIDIVEATVTFTLNSTLHTNETGYWEYTIEDNKSGEYILIGKGNIVVEEFVPFSNTFNAFLSTELPYNLTLENNFINQKLLYWRTILQEAFDISDADLEIESAWPMLVNALLAKLVVFEALELAARGSYVQFLGGSFADSTNTGGGNIKKIETGPANAEFYDMGGSINKLFYAPMGGISFFDTLKSSLCGLSNKLKVKLPMCKGNTIGISPIFNQSPFINYSTLGDTDS